MNHIYKVIWSKVKGCYVVVSEITLNHDKSARRVRNAAASALLAVAALTGGLTFGVPDYASAAEPSQYIAFETGGQYPAGNHKDGDPITIRSSDGSTYTYKMQTINDGTKDKSFWVRDGYKLQDAVISYRHNPEGSDTNQGYVINAIREKDGTEVSAGLVTGFHATDAMTPITTLSGNTLEDVYISDQGGVVNSPSFNVDLGSQFIITPDGDRMSATKEGAANGVRAGKYLKTFDEIKKDSSKFHENSDGTYTYNGQTFTDSNIYNIGGVNRVIVYKDHVYTGNVYGENNELLLTSKKGDIYSSVWATEIDDPKGYVTNEKLLEKTTKSVERDAMLAGDAIKKIEAKPAAESNKGSLEFTRRGKFTGWDEKTNEPKYEEQSAGTINITSEGGEGGTNKKIKFSTGTGADVSSFTVDAGSVVKANGEVWKEGDSLKQLSINGRTYDVAWKLTTNGGTGKENEASKVSGGDAVDFSGDNNIKISKTPNGNDIKVKIELAKDLTDLHSITIGGTKNGHDNLTGAVIIDNSGINAGGKKITNVAEGTKDTDAVNFGQLKEYTSVGEHGGFGITAGDGQSVKKDLGQTVKIVGDENITTSVIQNEKDKDAKVQISLKDRITLGDQENSQITIDGTSGAITIGNKILLGNQPFANIVKNSDGKMVGSISESGYFLTGLDNTSFTIANGRYKDYQGSNRAATEGQLYSAFDFLNQKIDGITINGTTGKDSSGNDGSTGGTTGGSGSEGGSTGGTTGGSGSISGSGNIVVTPKPSTDPSKPDSPGWDLDLNKDVTLGDKDNPGSLTIAGKDKNGNTANITINDKGSGVIDGLQNKTWNATNTKQYENSGKGATEAQLKQAMDGTVQYDRDENGNVKNSITLNKDENGKGTTITNVAAGKVSDDSTEAVNGSQLNKVQNQVDGNSAAITNIAGSVNKLGNRVNRVGAGAAALAALHPLDFDPDDKWDFSAGYGNYAGANAVAVGAYYRPNEDTMFSVGGSMGGGENMVNAGISVKLGQGNHVSTSRVAMAKEIKDLRAVVVMQGKQIQDLVSIVNQLTGAKLYEKNVADAPFPDVPENHWAYEYVHDLVKQGIIEGYPDGMYGGDRAMTRYEMAAFIWRLLQRGVNVPEKLQAEFHMELERFRVDTVAKDKDGRPTIERVRVNKVQ